MLQEVLRASVTLFVVLDVVGLIPIYIALVKSSSNKVMDLHAKRTTLFSSLLLFLFLFFGAAILNYFSISISDFKIAGGIILIIIGIKFVLGLRVLNSNKYEKHNFAVVPFAMPLLVGPGTITTTIILVEKYGYIIPSIAAIINLALVWFFLKNSRRVYKVLGNQGSDVLTRIMGLLITAIAVKFIREGFLI